MFLFRPFSCSDRKVVGEKKNKKSCYTGHDLIFWAFPLFYQDYTKRDGNFKSRPISLSPTFVRFWKAETISYIRAAFVSLTLPHGAYLGRICTDSPRAAKRVLSTFLEMTNVAAIQQWASPTAVVTRACSKTLFKWACVFS